MAFLIRFAACLITLLAVAAQVFAEVDVAIQTTTGESTLKVESNDDVAGIGGIIKIKTECDDGDSTIVNVQLGPIDGTQARMVLPLVPTFEEVLKNINKILNDVNKSSGKAAADAKTNVQNFFKEPLKSVQDAANKLNDDVHNVIKGILNPNLDFSEIKFNVPGIPDFCALFKKAGGTLDELKESGDITQQKLNEIGGAILKSALSQSENGLALLVDTVEKAVDKSLVELKEAKEIVTEAINKNLQNTVDKTAEEVVNDFINIPCVVSKIGSEAVNDLKNILRLISSSVVNISDESEDDATEDDDSDDEEIKISATVTTEKTTETSKVEEAAESDKTCDDDVTKAAKLQVQVESE